MKNRVFIASLGLPLLTMLAGCQHVSSDAAFAEVRSDVSQRLSKEVQWHSSAGMADAEPSRDLLTKELNVDTAVQIALLNNRSLQAEFDNIGIAHAELLQAGRLKNPRLDAVWRPPVSNGPAATASLDLAQNFLDLLMLPLRKKVAAAQFEVSKARVTASVLRLSSQTQRAFYEAQAAEQMLEVRKSIFAATDASAYASERLRAAGNITKLELNRERDQNDQARLDLSQAETGVTESRERVNQLLGLSGQDAAAWKIGARLPDIPATELDISDLEKRAVERNADLATSRREIEALARERSVANISSALSSLELGISASREDDSIWHVGPSLSVEIPIFDQGGARREKVEAEMRRALEQHAALAVNLRASVRAAGTRLTKAREQSILLRDHILPRRQEIIDDTQKEYNAMLTGVFQLLQAKRDQIDAARQYVERLRDYWIARSDVKLIGTGFIEINLGFNTAKKD